MWVCVWPPPPLILHYIPITTTRVLKRAKNPGWALEHCTVCTPNCIHHRRTHPLTLPHPPLYPPPPHHLSSLSKVIFSLLPLSISSYHPPFAFAALSILQGIDFRSGYIRTYILDAPRRLAESIPGPLKHLQIWTLDPYIPWINYL